MCLPTLPVPLPYFPPLCRGDPPRRLCRGDSGRDGGRGAGGAACCQVCSPCTARVMMALYSHGTVCPPHLLQKRSCFRAYWLHCQHQGVALDCISSTIGATSPGSVELEWCPRSACAARNNLCGVAVGIPPDWNAVSSVRARVRRLRRFPCAAVSLRNRAVVIVEEVLADEGCEDEENHVPVRADAAGKGDKCVAAVASNATADTILHCPERVEKCPGSRGCLPQLRRKKVSRVNCSGWSRKSTLTKERMLGSGGALPPHRRGGDPRGCRARVTAGLRLSYSSSRNTWLNILSSRGEAM